MNSDIVITSDSTTDLSPELKERYGIEICPLGITLGGKTYIDGVDITPDDIYAHHDKTGELPKTSATNVGECLDFFRKFTESGKTVIHFTISSEMSSTYANAALQPRSLKMFMLSTPKTFPPAAGYWLLPQRKCAKTGFQLKK